MFSRAIQHEADHLEGKLFIDYLEPLLIRTAGDKLRVFELEYRRAQVDGTIATQDDDLRAGGSTRWSARLIANDSVS